MLTGLLGIDIITPGTSTVGYVQDFDTDSFGRFQFALNTASINAFYVLALFQSVVHLLLRKLLEVLNF